MKRIALLLALLSPLGAMADMVNIWGADRWSLVDSHTIIVYRGSKALCLVKTLGFINRFSSIRFVDDTISNFDKVIIDGEAEDITKVTRL